ncbi:MAG: DUF503 domain-containing protein [Nitrospirae bacterium]|nr:DUF503 domain-containing protein [Nitrospirota bacterium]MCL5285574.1 DUF503 domain-containing protein [Nitrospirota bacterium]
MSRSHRDRDPSKRSRIDHLILILHFPAVHSLKEKRQVLSGLLSKIRDRYPVSVAETGYQDLWQRALVEAVMISSDPSLPDRIFEKIRELVLSYPEIVLLDSHRESL